MNHSILIIDDEENMTTLLKKHFQKQGFLAYTANNHEEAMEGLMKKPDIILLDINMPDMDGIVFCKTIRDHVNCPILFLTARVEETDKINGLIAGGDDYITKPFSLKELTARVEAHLRREQRSGSKNTVITAGGLLLDVSEQRVTYEGEEINFSKIEFELLSYLARNKGHILSRERIYEAVWGYDAMGDSNVIKEHVRKVRNKLMKATGKEYIETVWGMGYSFKG